MALFTVNKGFKFSFSELIPIFINGSTSLFILNVQQPEVNAKQVVRSYNWLELKGRNLISSHER